MKKILQLAAVFAALMPIVSQSVMAQRPGDRERDRERDRNRYEERFEERSFYDDRQRGGWDKVGQIKVAMPTVREVIRIDPRAERFSRLGLRVYDGDVEIVELTIRFANNESERVRVGKIVRAGTGLPPVDFPGRTRRLREIEVVYRPIGPARIELVGREGGFARWEELGCQKVGFFDGKDVIRVGRQEGLFRAIKLNVSGGNLRLDRLRVVYTNGQSDELTVRSVIPEGSETRPIDLSGRHRGIDRIELRYLPQLSFGGGARVCVSGI